MKMRLKKGDRVQVIQGKDIGKVGEVAHVYPDRNKVVVESSELINVAKKQIPVFIESDDHTLNSPLMKYTSE